MSPDPRDAEYTDRIVGAVLDLIRAVHASDHRRIFRQIEALLTAIIEHRNAMTERASDEPLRRAIAKLG